MFHEMLLNYLNRSNWTDYKKLITELITRKDDKKNRDYDFPEDYHIQQTAE